MHYSVDLREIENSSKGFTRLTIAEISKKLPQVLTKRVFKIIKKKKIAVKSNTMESAENIYATGLIYNETTPGYSTIWVEDEEFFEAIVAYPNPYQSKQVIPIFQEMEEVTCAKILFGNAKSELIILNSVPRVLLLMLKSPRRFASYIEIQNLFIPAEPDERLLPKLDGPEDVWKFHNMNGPVINALYSQSREATAMFLCDKNLKVRIKRQMNIRKIDRKKLESLLDETTSVHNN